MNQVTTEHEALQGQHVGTVAMDGHGRVDILAKNVGKKGERKDRRSQTANGPSGSTQIHPGHVSALPMFSHPVFECAPAATGQSGASSLSPPIKRPSPSCPGLSLQTKASQLTPIF